MEGLETYPAVGAKRKPGRPGYSLDVREETALFTVARGG
jgi:hypothetical protein